MRNLGGKVKDNARSVEHFSNPGGWEKTGALALKTPEEVALMADFHPPEL